MLAGGVDLVPMVDEGLGNSANLVDLGDGPALVVDVSRDLRAVHEAADKRGVSLLIRPARRFPLRCILFDTSGMPVDRIGGVLIAVYPPTLLAAVGGVSRDSPWWRECTKTIPLPIDPAAIIECSRLRRTAVSQSEPLSEGGSPPRRR